MIIRMAKAAITLLREGFSRGGQGRQDGMQKICPRYVKLVSNRASALKAEKKPLRWTKIWDWHGVSSRVSISVSTEACSSRSSQQNDQVAKYHKLVFLK